MRPIGTDRVAWSVSCSVCLCHTSEPSKNGVKLSDEDLANFDVLRDVAVATIFWLSICGVHIGTPGEYD